MYPLLTLDESTLFYWTLTGSDISHTKQKHAINKWASAVDNWGIPGTKFASRGPKSTSSRSKTATDIPSLTSGPSGRSYAPSVLSDEVKIVSHHSSDTVKVKPEHAPALSLYHNGGLSDNDEIKGEEREVAIKSPPKGKRRMTSEVFLFF
jgi:hypothetical protein